MKKKEAGEIDAELASRPRRPSGSTGWARRIERKPVPPTTTSAEYVVFRCVLKFITWSHHREVDRVGLLST